MPPVTVEFITTVAGDVDDFHAERYRASLYALLADQGIRPIDIRISAEAASVRAIALITMKGGDAALAIATLAAHTLPSLSLALNATVEVVNRLGVKYTSASRVPPASPGGVDVDSGSTPSDSAMTIGSSGGLSQTEGALVAGFVVVVVLVAIVAIVLLRRSYKSKSASAAQTAVTAVRIHTTAATAKEPGIGTDGKGGPSTKTSISVDTPQAAKKRSKAPVTAGSDTPLSPREGRLPRTPRSSAPMLTRTCTGSSSAGTSVESEARLSAQNWLQERVSEAEEESDTDGEADTAKRAAAARKLFEGADDDNDDDEVGRV